MAAESTFTLNNMTKAKLPRLAFAQMKDAALGEHYDLCLNIVSKEEIAKLNLQYRDVKGPTDILSFPLSENEGEMFINVEMTRVEAKKFGRDFENFLAFLFIHGLAHLAGYDHGSKMEEIEKKLRQQFEV